jgi:hypothetical protein
MSWIAKYILLLGELASFSLRISFWRKMGTWYSMIRLLLVLLPLTMTVPARNIFSLGFSVIFKAISTQYVAERKLISSLG